MIALCIWVLVVSSTTKQSLDIGNAIIIYPLKLYKYSCKHFYHSLSQICIPRLFSICRTIMSRIVFFVITFPHFNCKNCKNYALYYGILHNNCFVHCLCLNNFHWLNTTWQRHNNLNKKVCLLLHLTIKSILEKKKFL